MIMTARTHFQSMEALLGELEPLGIELEEHSYSPGALVAFTLVLRRNDERARFSWNESDAILTVECAEIENSVSWKHDAHIKVEPRDAVFCEMASEATQLFA
jgi:hypothetical protein